MVISALTSPVVLGGRVSDEKLSELLGLQAEYPELDYKRKIDPATGLVALAKDVGAMQVCGGYIVAGVDGHGAPTVDMDGVDARLFDEANLVPKRCSTCRSRSSSARACSRATGDTIVLIYIGRHPSGCAIFHTEGQYEKNGRPVPRILVRLCSGSRIARAAGKPPFRGYDSSRLQAGRPALKRESNVEGCGHSWPRRLDRIVARCGVGASGSLVLAVREADPHDRRHDRPRRGSKVPSRRRARGLFWLRPTDRAERHAALEAFPLYSDARQRSPDL